MLIPYFVPLRFAREVDHDCVVNGQFLPKGITVEIPAGFLHYDPEHWPEPEEFIPERCFSLLLINDKRSIFKFKNINTCN